MTSHHRDARGGQGRRGPHTAAPPPSRPPTPQSLTSEPPTSEPLTSQPLRDRPGARLSGSGDLDSRQALCAALGVVTRIPGPVVHLDLSAVVFLDPAAVAALVRAAASLDGQGRRLLLHAPPYSFRKVVEMFPDECAALEVAA